MSSRALGPVGAGALRLACVRGTGYLQAVPYTLLAMPLRALERGAQPRSGRDRRDDQQVAEALGSAEQFRGDHEHPAEAEARAQRDDIGRQHRDAEASLHHAERGGDIRDRRLCIADAAEMLLRDGNDPFTHILRGDFLANIHEHRNAASAESDN